jgi:quercetin dioxygenase-like cupin family protein
VIRRAAHRFHTTHDGIETWHSFSAGPHYDPDNVAYGALIAVDEHRVAAGAGFDWHAHRHVDIVSWVLSGRLRHEGGDGRVRLIGPGQVLVQRTGRGIRHCEVNASAAEPLHLIQMTLVAGEDGSGVDTTSAPVALDGGRFEVWQRGGRLDAARWHVHVTGGQWRVGTDEASMHDTARGTGPVEIDGSGELLVWVLT